MLECSCGSCFADGKELERNGINCIDLLPSSQLDYTSDCSETGLELHDKYWCWCYKRVRLLRSQMLWSQHRIRHSWCPIRQEYRAICNSYWKHQFKGSQQGADTAFQSHFEHHQRQVWPQEQPSTTSFRTVLPNHREDNADHVDEGRHWKRASINRANSQQYDNLVYKRELIRPVET